MKSIRISLMLFFLILTSVGFAQLKIGIKFSPGITPVRTSVTSDNIQVNEERSPLRMMAGLVVDYGNSDNYEFRSGINFIAKRYKYDLVFGAPGVNYSDEINMQYIQVPLTLKLNTNEVMLDSKIYVQLGASLDIKIHDNINELTDPFVTKSGFADASMIVAAGMDRKLGTETTAFAGFVYQRAFLNQASESIAADKEFKMQSGFIGLEIGVIF